MPIHAYGVADAELSGIIDRGLSKSPTARWQTMRDMGIALASWAVDHGINQDISGVSIQTEWLASQSPNLKTLQPAQLPRLAVPGAEPQVAYSTAPVVARDVAEWQGLRGEGRRKWIVGTVVIAVFVAAFIMVSKTTSIFSNSATPAPDADAGTPPAPSASAAPVIPTASTPSPVTSATAEAPPQPSARASASPSTTTTTPVVPTRTVTTTWRKAPPVPTNIKF
jgi:serine/threonine-protein kinase